MLKTNSLPSKYTEGFKSFCSQMVGRGGDWLIQNFVVYYTAWGYALGVAVWQSASEYGVDYWWLPPAGSENWALIAAAAIGLPFNGVVSYVLKRYWAYRRFGEQLGRGVKLRYLKLRTYLVPAGLIITYVPIWLFGAEFAHTSTIAFVINTIVLLRYSPDVFHSH